MILSCIFFESDISRREVTVNLLRTRTADFARSLDPVTSRSPAIFFGYTGHSVTPHRKSSRARLHPIPTSLPTTTHISPIFDFNSHYSACTTPHILVSHSRTTLHSTLDDS